MDAHAHHGEFEGPWWRFGPMRTALAAGALAALAIYDMCKAVDRDMVIGQIRLVRKSGGRSGEYRRKGET